MKRKHIFFGVLTHIQSCVFNLEHCHRCNEACYASDLENTDKTTEQLISERYVFSRLPEDEIIHWKKEEDGDGKAYCKSCFALKLKCQHVLYHAQTLRASLIDFEQDTKGIDEIIEFIKEKAK